MIRNSAVLILTFLLLACNSKKQEQPEAVKQDAVTAASVDQSQWLPEKSDSYEVKGFLDGIKGFVVKYDQNMYRGGNILTDKGALSLKHHGIRSVISVTPNETIRSLCTAYNLEHYNFEFDYQGLTPELVDSLSQLLEEVPKPVYIHCHGGNQRAGNVAMIYRFVSSNWSFQKAMDEYSKLGGKPDQDMDMMKMAFQTLEKSND